MSHRCIDMAFRCIDFFFFFSMHRKWKINTSFFKTSEIVILKICIVLGKRCIAFFLPMHRFFYRCVTDASFSPKAMHRFLKNDASVGQNTDASLFTDASKCRFDAFFDASKCHFDASVGHKKRCIWGVNQFRVCRFLGMDIFHDAKENSFFINCETYISILEERFNLVGTRGRHTPCSSQKLEPRSVTGEDGLGPEVPYRAAVGSLMFLGVNGRPDIAFAVNQVARHVNAPAPSHWEAVKRIMMYVISTKTLGIKYDPSSRGGGITMSTFSDSDWGGELAEGRSTSGMAMYLNGSLIEWSCKLQRKSTLSVAEAEYVSGSVAAQSIMHIQNLLQEINLPLQDTPVLRVDNQACIKIAKNPVYHGRVKHMTIRYHFLRQNIEDKTMNIDHVPGIQNVADIFTKPLGRVLFERHRDKLLVDKKTVLGQTPDTPSVQ